jgi:hypothetical protein
MHVDFIVAASSCAPSIIVIIIAIVYSRCA